MRPERPPTVMSTVEKVRARGRAAVSAMNAIGGSLVEGEASRQRHVVDDPNSFSIFEYRQHIRRKERDKRGWLQKMRHGWKKLVRRARKSALPVGHQSELPVGSSDENGRRASLPAVSSNPYMLNPLSAFKSNWDFCLLLIVLYTAVMIPWELAFELPSCDPEVELDLGTGTCRSAFQNIMEIFVNVIFLVDIVLSFRTGYEDKKMMIHMGPRDVAKTYVKSWFVADFCGSLPLDMLSTALSSANGRTRDMMFLRLFKCLRLLRLGRLLNNSKLTSANTFRIVKLTCGFFLVAHWAACLWYYVGRWQIEEIGSGNDFTGTYTWIQVPSGDEPDTSYFHADMRTKYTASLYWAFVTMYTVGYGDIVPVTNFERSYTMVIQIVGCVATALIFGNVALLIRRMDIAGARLNEDFDTVNEFIRFHNIPYDLSSRLRDTVEHTWHLYQGMDVDGIIAELPGNLRSEVLDHLHSHVLQENPLFRPCSHAFMKRVAALLVVQTHVPNDIIVHEEEAGARVYFISKGKVALVSQESDRVHNILGENDMFGEVAVFKGVPHSTSIQAISHVELYALSRESMDGLLEEFPQYVEPFIKYVDERAKALDEMVRRNSSCINSACSSRAPSLAGTMTPEPSVGRGRPLRSTLSEATVSLPGQASIAEEDKEHVLDMSSGSAPYAEAKSCSAPSAHDGTHVSDVTSDNGVVDTAHTVEPKPHRVCTTFQGDGGAAEEPDRQPPPDREQDLTSALVKSLKLQHQHQMQVLERQLEELAAATSQVLSLANEMLAPLEDKTAG